MCRYAMQTSSHWNVLFIEACISIFIRHGIPALICERVYDHHSGRLRIYSVNVEWGLERKPSVSWRSSVAFYLSQRRAFKNECWNLTWKLDSIGNVSPFEAFTSREVWTLIMERPSPTENWQPLKLLNSPMVYDLTHWRIPILNWKLQSE